MQDHAISDDFKLCIDYFLDSSFGALNNNFPKPKVALSNPRSIQSPKNVLLLIYVKEKQHVLEAATRKY